MPTNWFVPFITKGPEGNQLLNQLFLLLGPVQNIVYKKIYIFEYAMLFHSLQILSHVKME